MPPSRKWIEWLVCMDPHMRFISDHPVLLCQLPIKDSPLEQWTHQKVMQYFLKQREDKQILRLHDTLLTIGLAQIEVNAQEYIQNAECRREESAKRGLKLPDWPAPCNLPSYHIKRSKIIQEIISKVCEINEPRTVLIHGMGGCGKTLVAFDLLLHEEVKNIFPGGFISLTIGQNDINVFDNLMTIYRHLSRQIPLDQLHHKIRPQPNENSFLTEKIFLINAIKQITMNEFMPRCLLVLDDVWTRKELEQYEQLSLFCVATSRKCNVAKHNCVKIDVSNGFNEEETIEFWSKFLQKFQIQYNYTLQGISKIITEFCGYSPLAMSLIASLLITNDANVRSNPLFDIFRRLQTHCSQQLSVEGNYKYNSIIECIAASLDGLPITRRQLLQENYLHLVLFDDCTVITPQIMKIVWNYKDEEEAKLDLALFHNHSLIIEKHSSKELSSSSLTCSFVMHTLHVTFLRESVGRQIPEYQQQLINSLYKICDGCWWKLPNTDSSLWKIMWKSLNSVYGFVQHYPQGIVDELKTWNALGRALGLSFVIKEMKRCIRRSSGELQKLLMQFLCFIERKSVYLDDIRGKCVDAFEFIQLALWENTSSVVYQHAIQSIHETCYFPNRMFTPALHKEKDVIASWQCDCACVDEKRGFVYCGRGDGTVDRLHRNQHIKRKTMDVRWKVDKDKEPKADCLANMCTVPSFDLLAVIVRRFKKWKEISTNGSVQKVKHRWNEICVYCLKSFDFEGSKAHPFLTFHCPCLQGRYYNVNLFEFVSVSNVEGRFRVFLSDCQHHIMGNNKHRFLSLLSRDGMRFYGGAGNIPWNEKRKICFLRVINDRFLLLSTRCENKYLEVVDLFHTVTCTENDDSSIVSRPKVAYKKSLPQDCYIFHWFHSSPDKSLSLQHHRTVIIADNCLQILDGYLEPMNNMSNDSLKADQQMQNFMKFLKISRIKVWNVKASRHEIHYSDQWPATTNLLSCHQRPFANSPNVSYVSCEGFIGKSNGMREHNRRSNIETTTGRLCKREIDSLNATLDEIYHCECLAPKDREDELIRIVGVKRKNGKHQLKILFCQKPSLLVTREIQHEWLLGVDPLVLVFGNMCNLLVDIHGPVRYYSQVCYGIKDGANNEHEIVLFVFHKKEAILQIIEINKNNSLTTTPLYLNLPKKLKMIKFGLSPRSLVVVSPNSDWIYLFKIQWSSIQLQWQIDRVSIQNESHVNTCQMCPCGKLLAYSTGQFQQLEINIVSTESGETLMCDRQTYGDEISFKFCPHLSPDHLCTLLWTRSAPDYTNRYHQLFVMTSDGSIARSPKKHSEYIPQYLFRLRSAFSLCRQYVVTWSEVNSTWSVYRIHVTRDALECDLILTNQWIGSFSYTIFNEDVHVVFDQSSCHFKCLKCV